MSDDSNPAPAPAHTGSTVTRWLAVAIGVGLVVLVAFAFVFSEPDDVQGDLVRIMYIHVPIAVLTYLAFGLTFVGSVLWLWKRSVWWDTLAHAAAEVGVVFAALTLVTGSIWGRPTWGTFWEWGDVRMVTSLILLLLYVGYLAVRAGGEDREATATRAAVVGIVAAFNIPIVNRSVDWWANRTLHQRSTLVEMKIEDLTLFTLVVGFVWVGLVLTWLLVHRFRVGWLERQLDEIGLAEALTARRAEAEAAS